MPTNISSACSTIAVPVLTVAALQLCSLSYAQQLDYPIALTVGPKGDVFLADQQSQTVYKLDGSKLGPLYQGSKKYRTPLYRVKALAQTKDGKLYACCSGSMEVWLLGAAGKPAPTTAKKLDVKDDTFDKEARYAGEFDKPMAIALDSQGLPVVADLGLAAIVRIKDGKLEELAKVPAPRGIARDNDGSFVIVSHGKNQLVRLKDGKTSPIVSGTIAPKDRPSFPHNVVVNSDGDYLVSDGYARTIWKITRDGKTIEPLLQGDPLKNPVGLAVTADGAVLVLDPHAKALFRIGSDGKATIVVN